MSRSHCVALLLASMLLFASTLLFARLLLFARMLLFTRVLLSDQQPSGQSPGCPPGQFRVGTMKNCSLWLQCEQIRAEVRTLILIGGGMKRVFLAEWMSQVVVLSEAIPGTIMDSMSIMPALQGPRVVQLVGLCPEEQVMVTEFHPLGSLLDLDDVLAQERHRRHDNRLVRLRLAMEYVSVLSYLHESPAGRHVMCDTKTLKSTLSQYLVTSDLRLVVNDLDDVPEVDAARGLLVKCRGDELTPGDFVAPEQLWPFGGEGRAFSYELQPGYDEKTDIWKIPAVTRHLMRAVAGGDVALSRLSQVHKECKRTDPALRPSSQEVLRVYKMVYDDMVRDEPAAGEPRVTRLPLT